MKDNSMDFKVLSTDFDSDLTDISVLDEMLLITGSRGFSSISRNKGLSWVPLSLSVNSQAFVSCEILSSRTFFIASKNLFHSTDGGQSFKDIQGFAENPSPINAIEFSSPLDGVLVTGGKIYKTIDSGNSWRLTFREAYSCDIMAHFQDIWYIAGGDTHDLVSKGVLYRSNDGGIHWIKNLEIDQEILTLSILNSLQAFFTTKESFYKTSDGGQKWRRISTIPESFTSLLFTNPTTGYACSYSGNIYSTSDGGKSWTLVFEGTTTLTKIIRGSKSIIVIGNNGIILKN